VVLVAQDGETVPAQLLPPHPFLREKGESSPARVAFLLPELPAGEELRFRLEFTDGAGPKVDRVTVQNGIAGRVEVKVDNALVTAYRYLGNPLRPCFFPLLGPGGRRMTRSWPISTELADDAQDHPHHRSMWVAHGDVNGSDNWSEAPRAGSQLHREMVCTMGGPVVGRLAALTDWMDVDGRKVLEDRRALSVYALSEELRLLDLDLLLTASECDVRIGDTKEGGMLALRMACAIDGDHGGTIENSYGARGEGECWGRRAQWCDYWGEVEGERIGIAVFDHPDSFRHPTFWHVRGYGMYTANPFGWHDFYGNRAMDGSHILPRGASLLFRYRIYLHRGDTVATAVRDRYHDYANPPTIEVMDG
jgi:hypothetical protein